MGTAEEGPSLALGLFRVATLFAVVALILLFFREIYSVDAALRRLEGHAESFPYTQTCDEEGNLVTTGQPNCVDLGRYLFVHGPVNKAFRRVCAGREGEAATFTLAKGKAPRVEIVRVEKSLAFQARNPGGVPCRPPDKTP